MVMIESGVVARMRGKQHFLGPWEASAKWGSFGFLCFVRSDYVGWGGVTDGCGCGYRAFCSRRTSPMRRTKGC